MVCPDGFVCVDDPNDDCRPDAAGADCPALCEPKQAECTSDADCPQLRAPCPICPDGTSACGSSTCDDGVCNVSSIKPPREDNRLPQAWRNQFPVENLATATVTLNKGVEQNRLC